MRHRYAGKQLSRNSSHRKAMFRNMIVSLLDKETIKTTLPKAKELRRFIEPIITEARNSIENDFNKKRLIFNRIRNRKMVVKLFESIGPRYKNRPGGYVRILKNGYRPGDNAPMAIVQLVE